MTLFSLNYNKNGRCEYEIQIKESDDGPQILKYFSPVKTG